MIKCAVHRCLHAAPTTHVLDCSDIAYDDAQPMLSVRYNALVIVFWLGAMSWLLGAKVLPPLLLGEPPTYQKILAAEPDAPAEETEVVWDITCDQRPVGTASSSIHPMEDGIRELRSEVRFTELPLDSISPLRLGAFARLPDGQSRSIAFNAKAVFEVGPLGQLQRFESKLEMGILAEPVFVQGTVDGTQLRLTLRTGDLVYHTDSVLPQDSLLSDALSPQSRLPGLRVGQTWLSPMYSPFHPRTRPLEALEAVVERTEPLLWHGQGVETLVVVYYNEQGGRVGAVGQPRGKVWVRPDGVVLQQEVPLIDSVLRFIRRPPQSAAPHRDELSAEGGASSPGAAASPEGAMPE